MIKQALYDWLEDCGQTVELDVIAICCEFSQYDSAAEAYEQLIGPIDADDYHFGDMDENDLEKKALALLRDKTTVIEYKTGFVIQDF